ncbi:hypothetical protein [Oxynema aestuarii]|uniref:Uncharacterized protein n=1 Tax=Oxynema aestuarii AP17 TaxID=2064643 RepID=A0A6H1TZQ8_9CYAN|nr:hypothetical protein [Oxynema aestuarii]QIZ72074.1 hypothetical protein HCG48_17065 [Oxynema aestuarii AP17]
MYTRSRDTDETGDRLPPHPSEAYRSFPATATQIERTVPHDSIPTP